MVKKQKLPPVVVDLVKAIEKAEEKYINSKPYKVKIRKNANPAKRKTLEQYEKLINRPVMVKAKIDLKAELSREIMLYGILTSEKEKEIRDKYRTTINKEMAIAKGNII